MFRTPTVAIYREVFLEEHIMKDIKYESLKIIEGLPEHYAGPSGRAV